MASKTTLNVDNLQTLGAKCLAETLLDMSVGNTQVSQRLKLELAAKHDPSKMSKEMGKSLEGIYKAAKMLTRTEQKQLAVRLESYRKLIVDKLKEVGPKDSFKLLMKIQSLFDEISNRCNGRIDHFESVFQETYRNLREFAELSKQKPEQIAEMYYDWFINNPHLVTEPNIRTLAPSLGKTGLDHLNSLVRNLEKQILAETEVVSGPPDVLEDYKRHIFTARAIWTIADLRNDVDTYVEYYVDPNDAPETKALKIAQVMLRAGQGKNAIDTVQQQLNDNQDLLWEKELALMDFLILAYDSLKMQDKAQEARWKTFKKFLSFNHLQNYLQKLPDFEDFEAEDKALEHVKSFPNRNLVAKFWHDKGDFERLNEFILAEHQQLIADDVWIVGEIADTLQNQYPLAAILIYRLIISHYLSGDGGYDMYSMVSKLLSVCEELGEKVTDFGSYENHREFLDGIKFHSRWQYFFDYR